MPLIQGQWKLHRLIRYTWYHLKCLSLNQVQVLLRLSQLYIAYMGLTYACNNYAIGLLILNPTFNLGIWHVLTCVFNLLTQLHCFQNKLFYASLYGDWIKLYVLYFVAQWPVNNLLNKSTVRKVAWTAPASCKLINRFKVTWPLVITRHLSPGLFLMCSNLHNTIFTMTNFDLPIFSIIYFNINL